MSDIRYTITSETFHRITGTHARFQIMSNKLQSKITLNNRHRRRDNNNNNMFLLIPVEFLNTDV